MRVAIIGGTGFVGSYIVDALLAAGHEVRMLVRDGSRSKIRRPSEVITISGDLSSREALDELLDGSDALIYNVGLLREFPRKGITFEATQYQGVADSIAAARRSGANRMLLMSAIGVKDSGTAYQQTKYRAEKLALHSELDVTVLRPSVIFGDPRGNMEFATQLNRDMVQPPVPAIAFKGVRMSPVHVEDVADAFAAVLTDESRIGQTLELAGPDVLEWKDMVDCIAAATGRRKIIVPMPIGIMRLAAVLFDWLPFFPVTRDQLTMLQEGNTASSETLEDVTGRPARRFAPGSLRYLKQ